MTNNGTLCNRDTIGILYSTIENMSEANGGRIIMFTFIHNWLYGNPKKASTLPQVGDMVIVKGWDQMVDQYGYYERNKRINTACTKTSQLLFIREAEEYCGKQFRVVSIEKDKVYNSEQLEYRLDTPKACKFCDTMFIKVEWDEHTRTYVIPREFEAKINELKAKEAEVKALKEQLYY
ncbi:MAG: hypothetical protein K0S80_3751 [Neobacillus sp.]|nr:hypothetical protein [Neobacillus sp.]